MSNTAGPRAPYPIGRLALGVFFVSAGVAHFVMPEYFVAIVPLALPRPDVLVAVSGAAEIAGGIGLVFNRTRRAAAYGLLALLAAVFPANVQMLRNLLATGGGGWYEAALWVRLPFQGVLAWWVWRTGIAPGRGD